jgi:hypothetical protein
MDVDNVVYIDSLSDDEDEDEDEGKVIFIPDIEKRLTKIPENVLRAPEIELQTVKQGAGTSKDLVLYSVPKSLSVPDESDGVRKAIIESRARLRLKREAEEAERLQLEKVNASAAMADAMAVNGMGMNAMDGAGMMNGVNNMAASMNGMGIINGVNSVPVGYGGVYDPDEMDIE